MCEVRLQCIVALHDCSRMATLPASASTVQFVTVAFYCALLSSDTQLQAGNTNKELLQTAAKLFVVL